MIKGYATTAEAGLLIHRSGRRVRQLYRAGILKGQLVGRTLLIQLSSIERYQRRKEAAKRSVV